MATYKVPQDVEVADKLIGPLSLKQFIFVIVMIVSLWMAWVLSQINPLLGILPLPIAFVSGILGLYQRSDQPVEVFLASWVRFKTKPRKRIWDQEGFEERVIITVPKVIDRDYTNGMNSDQVTSRLGQLSALMDSRGWASKSAHALIQTAATPLQPSQQLNDDQRLLSAEDLSTYAQPLIPLDDTSKVLDPYENDPRNRVSEEVGRDIKQSQARIKAQAEDAITRARAEAPTTPQPSNLSATPKSSTPNAAEPTSDSSPKMQQNPITDWNNQDAEDDEVVIAISHKK